MRLPRPNTALSSRLRSHGHFALAACLAAGLTLASVGDALAQGPTIEVGRPFPDLTLRTLEGEAKRVSDFRGQKVVLHVFASW